MLIEPPQVRAGRNGLASRGSGSEAEVPGPRCSFSCDSLPSPVGEVLVVRVAGRLDSQTHSALLLVLLGAVRRAPSHVVVDLGAVTFCHHRALGLLAAMAAEAELGGVGYCLGGVPDHLNRADKFLWGHDRPPRYRSVASAVMAIRAAQLVEPESGSLASGKS